MSQVLTLGAGTRPTIDPLVEQELFGAPLIVIAVKVLLVFVLGLVGTMPPAWRCLRLPIPQALRSN